jgi:antitoxin component YwqK of YwqJK toxin-antitoxin module
MKKLLIITALALVLVSCQDKNVRHVQKVAHYYAETNLPWVIYYYDVVGKDSTWVEEKWFHENGVLQLEGKIVDNQREGVFKGYFPTGELMSVGKFVKGKREGKGKIYYENGKINIENEYRDGKPAGIWKVYDEEGNLRDVKQY